MPEITPTPLPEVVPAGEQIPVRDGPASSRPEQEPPAVPDQSASGEFDELDVEELVRNYRTPPPQRRFQVQVVYRFVGKGKPMPYDLSDLWLEDHG